MREAKQLVAELMQLDEETRLLGQINAPCRPLTILARFERDNLQGADPLLLARTTLKIYRDMFARSRIMTRKLRRFTEIWLMAHA